MRCPDCSKFVGLEEGEPEVDDLDVGADGVVTASVRIVRTCAECGTELKEATFDLESQPLEEDVLKAHEGEGHELTAEETGSEMTSRSDGKPGTPSRYRKSFYGAKVEYKITCSCGGLEEEGSFEDEVQASGMDEL